MKSLPPLLFVAALGSTVALADDAGLARCRAIADNAARLACYDAIPLPAPETKSGVGPEAKPATPATGAAAAGNVGPSAAPRFTAQEFGFEERIIQQTGPDKIDGQVAGKFDGWAPHSVIRLTNGQVWEVTDLSSRFYDLDSPKVTITRGMLSAFYFNVEGDNHTVRVTRVK